MDIGELGKQSQEARLRLVEMLVSSGFIQSSAVHVAFAAIPREAFVRFFYQQQGRTWTLHTPSAEAEDAWLAALYADESLVTKISERNAPISSSSMPSEIYHDQAAFLVAGSRFSL